MKLTKWFMFVFVLLISNACVPNVLTVRSGTSVGTGFYGPDGMIYTASHVLRDRNRSVEISALTELNASVSHFEGFDIAVLSPSFKYKGRYKFCKNYQVGDKVKVLKRHGISNGEILSVAGNLIYTSTKTKKGDSGSPVFNKTRKCILSLVLGEDRKTKQTVSERLVQ